MTIRTSIGSIIVLAAAIVICAPMSAQAQQPLAGPAAAVITTPAQQQAVVTALRPQPLQPYTRGERRGRPLVVFENGHEYVMIPEEEYLDELRKRDAIGNMSADAEPDPAALIDKDYSDLSPDKFVHVLDYLTPVKSQAGRGMCHAFAGTAMLETLIKRRLMRYDLPEHLTEVDLSEEWFCFQAMRRKSDYYATPEIGGEGFFGYLDLERVMDKDFVMEAYWPYEPDSWPDTPGHPAEVDWLDGEMCAWEWWAHRQPGELAPGCVAQFRDYVSPGGPMLSIRVESSRFIGEPDEGFDLARREISEGRPIMVSLVWPGMLLTNPQRTMYCVNDDYPFEALEAKLAGTWTDDQKQEWDDAYLEGHEVLLVGYGKPGTDCEGIWMVKNSWGLDSGNNGIVYLTEGILLLSYVDFGIGRLTQNAKADIDRFGETMREQLNR